MTLRAPELRERLDHGVRVWTAGRGPAWVGLAGPPTSSLLFRHLARPVIEAGCSLVLPELFDPPAEDGRISALVARLSPVVPEGALLLSHGLALPLARALALARSDLAGLVVISGPLRRLDPLSRALGQVARRVPALARQLLRPGLAVPALASSAGLRRAVVNPYVMDRDIVAMLSAPLLASASHRRYVAQYLADLASWNARASGSSHRELWLWSALDRLYPPPDLLSRWPGEGEVQTRVMDGARFMAVEEKPWDVARLVVEWARPPHGRAP